MQFLDPKVEPMVGIEPTTYGLRNRCSTTELHWRHAGHLIRGEKTPVKLHARHAPGERIPKLVENAARGPLEGERATLRMHPTHPGGLAGGPPALLPRAVARQQLRDAPRACEPQFPVTPSPLPARLAP